MSRFLKQWQQAVKPRFYASSPLAAIILAFGLMFDAAAGQSALFDFSGFVRKEQDTLALFIKATPKPRYSLPDSGPVPAVKKPARALVRGMNEKSVKKNTDLESFAKPLNASDEQQYRKLFTFLNEGNLQEAERITADIEDGTLLGAAQAAYILHPRNANISYELLTQWLINYGDLPQAQDVYKKALSMRIAGQPAPLQPSAPLKVASHRAGLDQAAPLEWKKFSNTAIEKNWRAGNLDGVWNSLKDYRLGENAPEQAYYPMWLKGLTAYSREDFIIAAESFALIAQSNLPDANVAAGAFWAARAFEKINDSEKHEQFMDIAAQSPHRFYGLLALAGKDALQGEESTALSFSKKHADTLKKVPAGLRALAFLQIGEKELAEKELQQINNARDVVQALQAVAEYFELGGLNKLSRVASYPVMPWQPRGGFVSDPSLVSAIAWNESRFNRSARNPSGASGIMQIMPDTAEHIAAGSSGSLFDPTASVTLGDKYIKELSGMNGIDGNLLLMIAGYNCGPGKVQQLFADIPHGKDPLLFLEMMPIKETRDYVQKVLMTYVSYRLRAGKPLTAIAALSRGQWPEYETVRTASR